MLPDRQSLESRVASSETAIAGLALSIEKVTSLVGRLENSVDSGFRDLAQQNRDINTRMADSRKPQYVQVFGTIFVAASVLLTVVGGVGKIVIDGQSRDISKIHQLADHLHDTVETHTIAISSLSTHNDDQRLRESARENADYSARITAIEKTLEKKQ